MGEISVNVNVAIVGPAPIHWRTKWMTEESFLGVTHFSDEEIEVQCSLHCPNCAHLVNQSIERGRTSEKPCRRLQ